MGTFIEAEEMKAKILPGAQLLHTMEVTDIDDIFIKPAEKLIAEVCNLDLNTDAYPYRWAGIFDNADNGPRLLAEYLADYKLAVIQTVNHMAANPLYQPSKSFKGASGEFNTALVPAVVKTIMQKWSAPRRIFRS